MTVRTVGDFGAMMLPFGDRERGSEKFTPRFHLREARHMVCADVGPLVGAVAGGATWSPRSVGLVLLGMVMAGPLLCAFSQVVNDWFDREVDAINEPERPTAANVMAPGTVLLVALGARACSPHRRRVPREDGSCAGGGRDAAGADLQRAAAAPQGAQRLVGQRRLRVFV